MKFTIEGIEKSQIQTKFGLKNKFRFVSGGQSYDAWEKKGYTDAFAPGYSFEAELTGRPFKGIDTIAWPKQGNLPYQPTTPQMTDAIKLTLERIEKKIDRLLDEDHAPLASEGLPTDIPPMPTDKDMPF